MKYTPLSAKERFTALQAGEIDVLSNTTWTLERDAAIGLTFVGTSMMDKVSWLEKLQVSNQLMISKTV